MRRRGGRLRALSGLLAGGLVALALALVVAMVVASNSGVPGPGASTLAWHLAGAAVAVGAQWYADRHLDRSGTAAALAVVVVTVAVLGVQWLV